MGPDMFQIEYKNKPSISTINSAIKKAIANNQNWIQLIWGENQILIEKDRYGWTGYGWIGKHGGHDIAHKLNHSK
jgi:hypothetical protein